MKKNKDYDVLDEFFDNISDEELLRIASEVKKLNLGGPTIDEYFGSFDANFHHLYNFKKQKRISIKSGAALANKCQPELIFLTDDLDKIIPQNENAEPLTAQLSTYYVNKFNEQPYYTA